MILAEKSTIFIGVPELFHPFGQRLLIKSQIATSHKMS
jgi:hypothetical protein